MGIHSSILARIIPWTEEPSGLQSMGSQELIQLKILSTHDFGKFKVNSIYLFVYLRSISKVLWEHRHVHSFPHCLCFHATKAELSHCDRAL